jgi:hypothetical protein
MITALEQALEAGCEKQAQEDAVSDVIRSLTGEQNHEALVRRVKLAVESDGKTTTSRTDHTSLGGEIDLSTTLDMYEIKTDADLKTSHSKRKENKNPALRDIHTALGQLMEYHITYPNKQLNLVTEARLSTEYKALFNFYKIKCLVVTQDGKLIEY